MNKLTEMISFHLDSEHSVLNCIDFVDLFFFINSKFQCDQTRKIIKLNVKLENNINRQKILEVINWCYVNFDEILLIFMRRILH